MTSSKNYHNRCKALKTRFGLVDEGEPEGSPSLHEEYKPVLVIDGGLVGGHYAVSGPTGTAIGKTLKLDQRRAEELAKALTVAFRYGKEQSLPSSMDNSDTTWPADGQRRAK